MRDFAHRASVLLHQALSPFLGGRLPLQLGREIYNTMLKRLRRAGLYDGDHAEEIFSRLIASSLTFLTRHGGSAVHHVRGWLYKIANNVTGQYLKEVLHYDTEGLEEFLEGERPLPDTHIQNEERVFAMVRTVIADLPPRLREFIELDLMELRSPDEICEIMGISPAYFKKIKYKALAALRKAILEKGVNPLI